MKTYLEKSFSEIGVKPVSRRRVEGEDILFGDGFVARPYPMLKKFGIEDGDFPNGCYVTVWLWSKGEDRIGIGLPIFFDCLHDIGQPLSTRKTMRLNAAIHSASNALRAMREARKNAH